MKLMILDGNSVINRAFYGVRLLTTKKGEYTNAIYGFLNILDRMRQEEQPDALCVAFDLHGPTFRHEKYDQYKATRHGMPEELAQQMPVMKDVLRAMNIPIYACQGWEADDVIGTIAKRCSEGGWDCVIVTGDRDSLQLVDEHVTVKLVTTKGGQSGSTNYTPAVFQEEYGFAPVHLIDLKALMGDNSDNIPGVTGIGPKTATELLRKYGTLDGVYENLTPQNMKGKLFEKLENGRYNAYLSYDLATIRLNAPVDFKPGDALVAEPDKAALYALFLRLEFVKLIDKYKLRTAAALAINPTTVPRTVVAPEGKGFRSGAQQCATQSAAVSERPSSAPACALGHLPPRGKASAAAHSVRPLDEAGSPACHSARVGDGFPVPESVSPHGDVTGENGSFDSAALRSGRQTKTHSVVGGQHPSTGLEADSPPLQAGEIQTAPAEEHIVLSVPENKAEFDALLEVWKAAPLVALAASEDLETLALDDGRTAGMPRPSLGLCSARALLRPAQADRSRLQGADSKAARALPTHRGNCL